jgi:hypothetical protein
LIVNDLKPVSFAEKYERLVVHIAPSELSRSLRLETQLGADPFGSLVDEFLHSPVGEALGRTNTDAAVLNDNTDSLFTIGALHDYRNAERAYHSINTGAATKH